MGIRDWIIEKIGLRAEFEERTRMAVDEAVKRAQAALPVTSNYDPNGEGYRRLTADLQRRENLHVDLPKMFQIVYYMWDTSLIFRRLALMDQSFIFSEPITITADEGPDGEVQKIINAFMTDSQNKIESYFPDNCMWLGLLGSQCWALEINDQNGHVKIGYIDPANIKEIITNPKNAREPIKIILQDTGGAPGAQYDIVRLDEDITSPTYSRMIGDCFFFSVNHPPNDPFGRSDFLTIIDWIDSTERYGFNFLERAELMLNFIWDVTCEGMTTEQMKAWANEPMNGPPKPGARRIHNEKIKWEAVTPDLKPMDFRTGFEMARSIIMGGHGRPDNWFGSGGKLYSNESDLMGLVPIKDLEKRQAFIKDMLTQVVQFAIDQAVIAGRINQKADTGFKIIMTGISKKDVIKGAAVIPSVTNSLAVAEDRGWLSSESATKAFAKVANSQLGLDIDSEAEIETAKAKLKDSELDYGKYLNDTTGSDDDI